MQQIIQNKIQEIKKSSAPIMTLDLSHHNIGNKEMEYLAKAIEGLLTNINKHLSLNLWHTGIGNKEVWYLYKATRKSSSSISLDLGHNKIGNKGAWYVSKIITEASCPIYLSLSYNNVGNKGAWYLSKAIMEASWPIYFILRHNNMGSRGVQPFTKAITNAPIPISLHLEEKRDKKALQKALSTANTDNIAVQAFKSPKSFLKMLKKHIKLRDELPIIGLSNEWLNNDVASIIGDFLGDTEFACINMQIIRNRDAITDNKSYTINYKKLLDLTPSSSDIESSHNCIRKILKQVDQYVVNLLEPLVPSNKVSRMYEVAQEYNFQVENANQNPKSTYLQLAKALHPDKGGSNEAFSKLDAIYRENYQDSLIKVNNYILSRMHNFNIGIKFLDLGINIFKTTRDFNIENVLQLVKDGTSLLGIYQQNTGLMLLAGAIDLYDKLHDGDYTGAVVTVAATVTINLTYGKLIAHAPTIIPFITSIGFTAYSGYELVKNIYNLYDEYYQDNQKTIDNLSDTTTCTISNIVGECAMDDIFDL